MKEMHCKTTTRLRRYTVYIGSKPLIIIEERLDEPRGSVSRLMSPYTTCGCDVITTCTPFFTKGKYCDPFNYCMTRYSAMVESTVANIPKAELSKMRRGVAELYDPTDPLERGRYVKQRTRNCDF